MDSERGIWLASVGFWDTRSICISFVPHNHYSFNTIINPLFDLPSTTSTTAPKIRWFFTYATKKEEKTKKCLYLK